MRKIFLYGLGCISSFLLCGFIALIIVPAQPLPTYANAYVESIALTLFDLDGKIPSIANLIINPQFDDSWDAKVEQVHHAMRKAHDKLGEVYPPSKWKDAHDDLMTSVGYCVTSTDMLRGGADAIGTSESFMDLCVSGIERFKVKIEPFIDR